MLAEVVATTMLAVVVVAMMIASVIVAMVLRLLQSQHICYSLITFGTNKQVCARGGSKIDFSRQIFRKLHSCQFRSKEYQKQQM